MDLDPGTFTPFNIELSARKFKTSWINLGDHTLDKPFFADSINQIIGKNAPTHVSDGSPLLKVYDEADYIEPTAFIFHVSRCGSTLISNCLRCLENTVVISEAQPISALLVPYAARFLPAEIEDWKQTQQTMLRSVVMNYGLKRRRNLQHLFIKFSSWNINMIGTIRGLWPQTPVLFIYRHPLEVLNSLLLKHPQWIRLCLFPDLYRPVLKMTKATIDKISLAEYFTRMLKGFYSTGLQHANDIHLLNYEAINLENLRQFLCHLSIFPTPSEMESMAASLNYYSKSESGKETFKPTGPRREDNPEAMLLSKKHLEKYYHLLNARAGKQALFHGSNAF